MARDTAGTAEGTLQSNRQCTDCIASLRPQSGESRERLGVKPGTDPAPPVWFIRYPACYLVQVLRFNAYFKESVTESNEENYRVRK